MFTGIIQALGKVTEVGDTVLVVEPPYYFAPTGFDLGESVAVNGCCLTVVDSENGMRFDVSPESWARTSLGSLKVGDPVNLERAMTAGGRFGGHVVQGHVDATGTIVSIQPSGEFVVFRVSAPKEYDRYLIDKGSVTIDGISLTVVSPVDGEFDMWIIPHTLEKTNLHAKTVGDKVNLEFDVIAKYVEKMMSVRLAAAS